MCLFQLYRYMIQLCIDVYLFSLGSFSHIGDYSVLINFSMLFSSYFLIISLIYITVYVLILNS